MSLEASQILGWDVQWHSSNSGEERLEFPGSGWSYISMGSDLRVCR